MIAPDPHGSAPPDLPGAIALPLITFLCALGLALRVYFQEAPMLSNIIAVIIALNVGFLAGAWWRGRKS